MSNSAINTFYIKDSPYSREVHEYDKPPEVYGGHLIFHYSFSQWDVVRDGKIVGMYAGLNGAKRFIDKLVEETT
ncbi:MAG: hypothetical protein DRQ89_12515 [Epsilonproteobacteria bacterium]|nr:MAG: hypothetical protein DRQ89_12515 [Campylobacterota bacterium]